MPDTLCAICNCLLHRGSDYARPTVQGRSHATRHHHVAERFFGRSASRRGTQRESIFETCPWRIERQVVTLCYECHEELVHNPVFLPADIASFALLVQLRGFQEESKTDSRKKIGGRIQLLHEVIEVGLRELLKVEEATLHEQNSHKGAPNPRPQADSYAAA